MVDVPFPQEPHPSMRMQTGYGFNTISDEEIREIAQALAESDATGGGSGISEAELREIVNALQETTLCDTAGRISQLEKGDKSSVVNIAVLGESGSGKSTFINVIRGLDDDEVEGAAKTGVVETTKYPTAYPHPKYKNVLFWDHPGSGTPGFDFDTYLKSVNAHQYNFFIIVASGRVRHNDMELAKELWSMGKKFFFVRNKIDSDLKASKLRKRKTYNEERILTDVRTNCMKNLMDCGIRLPVVFLLSCLELEKYDFHFLKKTLEKDVMKQER
ncbi:PREDICTED: interferon-inducible GTPase 1-like [Nanorana parkeri]|uniref:interferon-inducible GTPase 1-like n=1 Tax=Nanorana parkeri TaxID=125878 RepID=UPI0008542A1D|nr:PREDICTED: interferon-inducible GTPase 1-like [Nanorana parkeri]